jgi:hypothetical protein
MTDEPEHQQRQPEEHQEGHAPAPQYVTHIDTVHGTINIGSTVHGGPAPAPPAGLSEDSGYNVAAIHELLLEAFTVHTLPRFCLTHPPFRAIARSFGPNDGLDVMVDKALRHVATQFLWEELLTAVQEENPNQYARFESRLRTAPSAPPAPPSPAGLVPAEMLDALQRVVRDYVPAAARGAALAQVTALREAAASSSLDLAAVEAIFRWFDAELPALSGTLLSIVLHLGRQLQAGRDDTLWLEFQQRFAGYID